MKTFFLMGFTCFISAWLLYCKTKDEPTPITNETFYGNWKYVATYDSTVKQSSLDLSAFDSTQLKGYDRITLDLKSNFKIGGWVGFLIMAGDYSYTFDKKNSTKDISYGNFLTMNYTHLNLPPETEKNSLFKADMLKIKSYKLQKNNLSNTYQYLSLYFDKHYLFFVK